MLSKMTHNFTFSRDELMELLAAEFASGWNQCSDAFKLDAQIVSEGPRGIQNYLVMNMMKVDKR